MWNPDLYVSSGEMRDRVSIQSCSTTRDAMGGVTEDWTNEFASVWANVNPLTGRELQEAAKQWADVETTIEIRYRDGIDSTMRAVDAQTGVEYDIRAVIDIGSRRRKILLMCRTRL